MDIQMWRDVKIQVQTHLQFEKEIEIMKEWIRLRSVMRTGIFTVGKRNFSSIKSGMICKICKYLVRRSGITPPR